MEKAAKHKVETCVADYVRLFPDEFQAFKKESDRIRAQQRDQKFTTTKGTDALQRKLGEIPETLYNSIIKTLTQYERDWFLAQGSFSKDFRGPYWFYKKYPVFAITTV